MRITALGSSVFYNHPKNIACNNKALMSAPKSLGADIFCFKGNNSLAEKISIIPSSNQTPLEKNIEKELGVSATKTEIKKFANGETYINIDGKVRGKDVYLMPSSNPNVNDNLMETYLKADAAKRAGAKQVIAVIPNFDYARQERKTKAGEPIAARLNMDLLKASGVDEVITTDLHAPAIEGFASNQMKVTHLNSTELMGDYIKSKNISDLVIVSPDMGGAKRAEKLADTLGCDKAVIHKKRQAHNEATAVFFVGDVEGKNCVIYDDIIDTAGTIAEAARMLKQQGAKDIYVCAAHGLFNGKAIEKLNDAPIKEVIVTNSTVHKKDWGDKFKEVDLASQISKTILDISA